MSGGGQGMANRIRPRPWPGIWQDDTDPAASIAPWVGQKSGFGGDHSAWIDALADACEIEAIALLFHSSHVTGGGMMTGVLEMDSRELTRAARALRGGRLTLDDVDAILSRLHLHIRRLTEGRGRLRELIAEYRRVGT
jgi:hypothetical protein